MDTTIRRGPRYKAPESKGKQTNAFAGSSVEQDMEASIAAVAINQACGGTSAIAWSAGVGEREARRYKAGGAGNPLHRAARVIERCKDPFAVVGFFAARAVRALLVKDPMPEWRWRSLTLQAIRDEAHPDGTMDVVESELLTGKSNIRALFVETAKHVGALLRLMALLQIGLIRGWTLNGPHTERVN